MDQVVSQLAGTSQNVVGKLFDATSCGPVNSGSVDGYVHEAWVGNRASDFTDQQTFSSLDVCDFVDNAA